MTVDTKGFVLTSEKNPYKIFNAVKFAIFEDIKTVTGIDDVRAVWGEKFSMPRAELTDIEGYFTIHFKYNGDERMISVFTSCDHDYNDVRKGKRVIFSLGCYGDSIHLIEIAMKSLKGRKWICNNDCEEDWRELK